MAADARNVGCLTRKDSEVMWKVICVTLLVASLAATGCKPDAALRKGLDLLAPDDDEKFAQEYFETLRKKDFDTATGLFDQQFVESGFETKLSEIASLLGQEEPVAFELVGCNVVTGPGRRRTHLTYQYHFTNSWRLASLVIDTAGAQKRVVGVNVTPIARSLKEINSFTLSGKSPGHYVVLAMALAVPAFIVWTIVLCIRTRMGRKWLWIVFILIGATSLSLNWTTGQTGFQLISFHIPGAGISKLGLYAPWVVKVSFPLGAVIFLVRRKRIQAAAVAPSPTAREETPPEDTQT